MNEKILITGGAGYVGSHCVKVLVDAGYDCVVYDNLSRGHKEFVKWCPLVVGDIRDQDQLIKVFRANNFSAVMHFAALAYVGESVNNPLLYWDNNVIGTKTLLETMVNTDVNKIVFSSSCAVYGQPKILPINETTPTLPINPYGYTKLACENLMDHLNIAHELKSIRFRYFNAAGSDYLNGLGEWHEPETHLIPLVIEAAIGKRDAVKIMGKDFPTIDGTAIRDYVHVKDLALAHKKGIEYLFKGGATDVFNLGTGIGASVNQVIETTEFITNREVPKVFVDPRPGDPAKLVANVKKVNDLLEWQAKFTLANIIEDAYCWHFKR